MTNAQHTPGPWQAHYGWASNNLTSPDPVHPEWCEVTGGSFEEGNRISVTGHVGIANARLIAAAPQQNALLNRMVNDRAAWRRGEIGTTDYELAMRHNLDDAAKLIAKATGQAA